MSELKKITPGGWAVKSPDKNEGVFSATGVRLKTYEISSPQSSPWWIAHVQSECNKNGAENTALIRAAPEMYKALKRIKTILAKCPITVRQIIESGDEAIIASGVHPYCLNEGADGDRPMDLWFIDAAVDLAETLPEDSK